MKKVLVIGASGQIGTDLTMELRRRLGNEQVVAADLREAAPIVMQSGTFTKLDVLDKKALEDIVDKYKITEIYHLAAILSGNAEKAPKRSWDINMEGLFNVLDVVKDKKLDKIFWPSSIAVFGPSTPRENTPQDTVMDPNTVYGISKLAGERWCEYYHDKFGVDVRSLRYPGLISYSAEAGGGTTDYAVEIFYDAIKKKSYTCFLKENTSLPMMFMEDAINATIGIMDAPEEKIKIRSSYNIAGISFNPKELASEIKELMPDFTISYQADFRQAIADSWPKSIDETRTYEDWQWKAKYDIKEMTAIMLEKIAEKIS